MIDVAFCPGCVGCLLWSSTSSRVMTSSVAVFAIHYDFFPCSSHHSSTKSSKHYNSETIFLLCNITIMRYFVWIYLGWKCSRIVYRSLTIRATDHYVGPWWDLLHFLKYHCIWPFFLGCVCLWIYKWWKRHWILSVLPKLSAYDRFWCVVVRLPRRKY